MRLAAFQAIICLIIATASSLHYMQEKPENNGRIRNNGAANRCGGGGEIENLFGVA